MAVNWIIEIKSDITLSYKIYVSVKEVWPFIRSENIPGFSLGE
jgi:hypothetical protein